MIIDALKFIAGELKRRADEELFSEDAIYRDMTAAYAELESGAMSEDEFRAREQSLMDRLEVISARKEAQASGDDNDDGDDDDDHDCNAHERLDADAAHLRGDRMPECLV